MRYFEITTFEWPAQAVADEPDLALESVKEAINLTSGLNVAFTRVGADYQANSVVWRVTGPDVDAAAVRLDADVKEEVRCPATP